MEYVWSHWKRSRFILCFSPFLRWESACTCVRGLTGLSRSDCLFITAVLFAAQATVSSVCTQLDLQDGKKTKNQEVSAAATEVSPSVLSRTQSEEQTLQSGLKTRRQTDLLEKGKFPTAADFCLVLAEVSVCHSLAAGLCLTSKLCCLFLYEYTVGA